MRASRSLSTRLASVAAAAAVAVAASGLVGVFAVVAPAGPAGADTTMAGGLTLTQSNVTRRLRWDLYLAP